MNNGMEYVGKLDFKSEKALVFDHPLGESWKRIEEPCVVVHKADKLGNVQHLITKLFGKNYRRYVDINMTYAMDIRELDQNGPMYTAYKREASGIILPKRGIAIPLQAGN
jgi:hypothetical protein